MHDLFKVTNTDKNRIDRKSNTTMINSIFKDKYNSIIAIKSMINFIKKVTINLIRSPDFNEPLSQRYPVDHTTHIIKLALHLLGDAQNDYEDSIELLKVYVNTKESSRTFLEIFKYFNSKCN